MAITSSKESEGLEYFEKAGLNHVTAIVQWTIKSYGLDNDPLTTQQGFHDFK